MTQLPKTWREVDHYILSVDWLSRSNRRKQAAQLRALEQVAVGRELDPFTQLELNVERVNKIVGWHHHMTVITFSDFHSVAALMSAVGKRLKRNNLGPGGFEVLFAYEDAPLKLSAAQKREVENGLRETLTSHDFVAEPDEVFRHFVDLGQYGLEFRVEYLKYREEVETQFEAEDNLLHSLTRLECTLSTLEPDAEAWQEVATGTFGIDGRALSLADWSYEVKGNPEIAGVAFEEAYFDTEEGLSLAFVAKGEA